MKMKKDCLLKLDDMLLTSLVILLLAEFTWVLVTVLNRHQVTLDGGNYEALVKCLDDLEENETCVVEYTFTGLDNFDSVEVIRTKAQEEHGIEGEEE